jgi:hypothetical protein
MMASNFTRHPVNVSGILPFPERCGGRDHIGVLRRDDWALLNRVPGGNI